MNKKKILYSAVVFAQIMVLIVMIVRQENLLASDTKILLKCKPVDPRSLFSGDYVILNYDISRIPNDREKNSGRGGVFVNGGTVYVALKKTADGKYYEAADYGTDISGLKKNYSVIIKGRISGVRGHEISINYGIEQYFVPQNQGKDIERDLGQVSVLVSLDKKGNSAVSRIYIEEKEVKFY